MLRNEGRKKNKNKLRGVGISALVALGSIALVSLFFQVRFAIQSRRIVETNYISQVVFETNQVTNYVKWETVTVKPVYVTNTFMVVSNDSTRVTQ